VRPVRAGAPSDPPAIVSSGYNRATITSELALVNVTGTYTYGQLYTAMVEQFALEPGNKSFSVFIRKIMVYATKAGDPRDIPRMAVEFRMAETATASLLVVEDRGTLTKPARVAARYPKYQFAIAPTDTTSLLVISGNGAAAPKALLVSLYISLGWKSNQLVPPNYDVFPLLTRAEYSAEILNEQQSSDSDSD
jgi:hypothetical protein